MAARAIWKAVVALDDMELPVKLYSAVEDRRVHFRLLHAADRHPVEQRMVHPRTGDVVPPTEFRRGLERPSAGTLTILDADELEKAQPEPSRVIEITRFVPTDSIGMAWYERPFYLGPDGSVDEDYFALAEALADLRREGVARWTMRKNRYVGALRSTGGYLVLTTLRFAGEVVESEELGAPEGPEPSAKERKMAGQLMKLLEGHFEAADFENHYRARVRELIESKAAGQTIALRRPVPRPATPDLSAALSRSLERIAHQERRRAS